MPWKKINCSKAKHYLNELHINARDFKSLLNALTIHGEFKSPVESRLFDISKNNIQNYTDALYNGLPDVELSVAKAKEIMGEDFYGAERYIEVFGQELYLDELGRVPFTVSELRKAKEKGMRLVARYDLKNVTPSIVSEKIQDLGINLPSDYSEKLTERVENGWALVGERGELTHLYQYAQLSWERALEFLGHDFDNEAYNDVKHSVELIKKAYLENDIDTANEDLMDLMTGTFANGPYFLVKANEAIYDALLISKGDPKRMREMLDSVVTGTVVEKENNRWEFLELDYFYGTGQNFEFSNILTKTHGLNRVLANGMPYQIRV
ncbi:hypothetical protein IT407_03205 [Candidatus Uhrbacteria bacterium]|nr:hypothetical protein [Candidatus Uhrbacteria bacterium]